MCAGYMYIDLILFWKVFSLYSCTSEPYSKICFDIIHIHCNKQLFFYSLWTSWDERMDRGKTVYPLPLPVEWGYNKAPMTYESRKPAVLSMVKSGRSPIRWREGHQQQMKIRSDLGNRHPVTIDQLVMPAIELLEGWPQPKICLQITQILHKVLHRPSSCLFVVTSLPPEVEKYIQCNSQE
jgi:hypothetical protein